MRRPRPLQRSTALLLGTTLALLVVAPLAAQTTPTAIIRPAAGEPPWVHRAEGNWAARLTVGEAFARWLDVPLSRLVLPQDAPTGPYDFVFTGYPDVAALRRAVASALLSTFGLRAQRATRREPVLVLTLRAGGPPLVWPSQAHSQITFQNGVLDAEGTDSAALALAIEQRFGRVVVDEAHVAGPFDVHAYWEGTGIHDEEGTFPKALQSQGLDLVPGERTVDVVLVERTAADTGAKP